MRPIYGKSHLASVWRGCGVYMAEIPHFTCGGLQRAGLGQPFPICFEEVVAVGARGHIMGGGAGLLAVPCTLNPEEI